jgi:DNA-binding response OmpR family regulator
MDASSNESLGDVQYTIAAVDDNVAHMYALERTLRHYGYRVQSASNGEGLLSIIDEKTDLVILDVNLPDIDGFQICRRLRQNDKTCHLPVIFLSASNNNSPSQAMADELGADAFLGFPIEPEQLDIVIRGTLARRSRKKSQL